MVILGWDDSIARISVVPERGIPTKKIGRLL
jgi:hypothetical protein